jgi:hypothetical protein
MDLFRRVCFVFLCTLNFVCQRKGLLSVRDGDMIVRESKSIEVGVRESV